MYLSYWTKIINKEHFIVFFAFRLVRQNDTQHAKKIRKGRPDFVLPRLNFFGAPS